MRDPFRISVSLVDDRPRISADSTRLKLLNSAGTRGILLGSRCLQCGHHVFGNAPACQACSSTNIQEVSLGTLGTLFSYTIVRTPPPGWQGDVPYALGQVELPQGPHVISQIVDCPFDLLETGMQLELAIADVGKTDGAGDVVVYKWHPAI